MVNLVLKIFKALNSEVGPWQISFAGAFAMIIGFTPLWSPHNLVILLLVFILRVHLATFFVFWGLFSGLAFFADGWFHQLGLSFLQNPAMTEFWTGLYQNDFWLATRFNHSITLGSLFVTLVAFIPVAIFFRLSVVQYRAHLLPFVNKLKIVQMLKGSKVYQLYSQIAD